ncbi:MAG: HD domain-containing protein [Desulfobacterales bacterium]|nr:HD domain-containing protein [Desulfobacterales bacterium]
MKTQFVKDLKAGDSVDDMFALTEKNLAQKKDGNNFINVVLSDKTGSIKGVVWDNVDALSQTVSSGDPVQIEGIVSEYRGVLQLVIKKMAACSLEALDPLDFIPATRRDIDAMFERILSLTASIEIPYLKKLLDMFWSDTEVVQKFKIAPAAKKMHHAYLGGLLEHSLSMALLVDKIAGHFSGLNRDLLLTGAILHDIGKIREFEYKFSIDYTVAGRLLNHIVIGIQMIEQKLLDIQDFPEEEAYLLKHLIVSHHGSREFGSPEPPKTIEAVLLNYIDEIDAKVTGIRDFISTQDPTETWTSYHRLLERYFYIGKNKEQSDA